MGFEFNFKITAQDLEHLSRSPDGIEDLDRLLRSAPSFKEARGSTYTYSEEPEDHRRWPATISLQDSGFCLCIYNRSTEMRLMNFLIHELLSRCGRVEVEDA